MERCLRGLEADEEKCRKWVEESVGVITALCPVIGYQASAKIAKEAIATGLPIRKVLLSKGLFSEEKVEELLNPENLV